MRPYDYFYRSVQRHPDAIALVDVDRSLRVSYGTLAKRVTAMAAALQDLSHKKRPVVAIAGKNSADMVCGILAVYAMNGVYVPLTVTTTAADIQRQISTVNPDVVILDSRLASLYDGVIPTLLINDEEASPSLNQRLAQYERQTLDHTVCDLAESIALKFTGGSTGQPKVVEQSMRCINAMVTSMLLVYPLAADENFIISAPVTHGAGTFLLPVFYVGGTIYITANNEPQHLLNLAATIGRVSIWLPPTLLHKLVQAQKNARTNNTNFKQIIYGGGPLTDVLLAEAINIFGPIVGVTYGLTEAPVIIAGMDGSSLAQVKNANAVGFAGPLCQVGIKVDNTIQCASYVVGEIVAAGDLVMSGYKNTTDESESGFEAGWFRTGDIGYFDDKGMLFITGRLKEMIISGGFNIYPKEIEEAYADFYEVSECCALGVADEYWGEKVVLIVSLQPQANPTKKMLIEFGKNKLGAIKTPKAFYVVPELPKNELGKIDKKKLMLYLKEKSIQEIVE